MKVPELFRQINGAYRGTDDSAPTQGTDDYELWIDTANRKITEWSNDSKNTWETLWEVKNITGVVVANDKTYSVDATLIVPSDQIYITDTSGNKHYYTLVKPQERDNYIGQSCCYINKGVLNFIDDIKTGDVIVGGTISIPGYYAPTALADDNSTVPVVDPYWLVYATASELAFNDLTYSDKANDLAGKANFIYSQMANNNRRGTNRNPRITPVNLKKIGMGA